ncbi:MAG TPA: GNAT family N-acetyltransferase [Dictyobacter sp.]|jgi:GNAT superfamily N-acetyltransferase|nr:GNAT family N-acetyltransferase [Dictyobacter sp.]
MSMPHQDLADPSLLIDVEHNFAEEMACFARHAPNGKLHEDGELQWFSLGPDGPNGLLITSFPAHDAAYIHQRIDDIIQHFKNLHAQNIGWRIGPTTTPTDLSNYLKAHGFQYSTTVGCMILHAAQLQIPTQIQSPEGLTITEVLDTSTLRIKCAVEQRGFSVTEQIAESYFYTYSASGFGADKAWHHYVAWLDGQAAGVASLLLHRGVAGIYGVTTLPEVRRQGIGTALTQHVIQEAQKYGYPITTLSNTEMSEALYHRLGFQNYCLFHHYGLSFIE